MQEQGGDEVPAQMPERGAAPRFMMKPEDPTQREREEHAVDHYPFRSWCRHCVEGRGVERPHCDAPNREDDAAPLISADYGFAMDDGQR